MSMITNSARFLLFGPKQPATINLRSIAIRKALNMVRVAFGMPPSGGPGFTDWLFDQLKQLWAKLVGRHPDALPLPDDMPVALFKVINETLKNRGGVANRDLDLPNYWIKAGQVYSTPFFWVLPVDYGPAGDPTRAATFETVLEDQLIKAGYSYNVRIQMRPLRIEIDKPEPPMITLAELWPVVEDYKQNKRLGLMGMAFVSGNVTIMNMEFAGEDFSAFIAASSGGGKTQLAMALLLSLAMSNSPDYLSMILIDPKAVDFRPFGRLPHLALPVVTEAPAAVEALQVLCDEMDRRTACAARGDNSFFAHTLLLYIDEMADLLASLPSDQKEKAATNIQRLGQKGRGVGFVIIGATQRVFDVPANAHTKLNARYVGKMRSAGDSVAASGIPGTTTNLLPGRGSFELYCSDQNGLRIQAPFVAASDKDGYEQALKPFFDAITQRWGNGKAGWAPPTKQAGLIRSIADLPHELPVDAQEPPQDTEQIEKIEVDARLWQAMIDAHQAGKLTANAVRKMHAGLLGKSIDGYKAKGIFDAFLGAQQPQMANSGDD